MRWFKVWLSIIFISSIIYLLVSLATIAVTRSFSYLSRTLITCSILVVAPLSLIKDWPISTSLLDKPYFSFTSWMIRLMTWWIETGASGVIPSTSVYFYSGTYGIWGVDTRTVSLVKGVVICVCSGRASCSGYV